MKKILILSLVIVGVTFSSCSSKHAIKRSPCACYDVAVLQKDRG
ncbi:hypothetical protein [uncultured Helicobacter sp.]|nr:hypothetical protein [uncultured Helicobacter sp.]